MLWKEIIESANETESLTAEVVQRPNKKRVRKALLGRLSAEADQRIRTIVIRGPCGTLYRKNLKVSTEVFLNSTVPPSVAHMIVNRLPHLL